MEIITVFYYKYVLCEIHTIDKIHNATINLNTNNTHLTMFGISEYILLSFNKNISEVEKELRSVIDFNLFKTCKIFKTQQLLVEKIFSKGDKTGKIIYNKKLKVYNGFINQNSNNCSNTVTLSSVDFEELENEILTFM